MFRLLKLFVLFFILIGFQGCRTFNDTPYACGIENPQENIEWLKNILSRSACLEIYVIKYDGQEFIGIFDCNVSADVGAQIYDCEGNIYCYFIGFTGKWTCDEKFMEAVEDGRLIYTQETNPIFD